MRARYLVIFLMAGPCFGQSPQDAICLVTDTGAHSTTATGNGVVVRSDRGVFVLTTLHENQPGSLSVYFPMTGTRYRAEHLLQRGQVDVLRLVGYPKGQPAYKYSHRMPSIDEKL